MTANLLLLALWVLPSALEVTTAARAERIERQRTEQILEESRQRTLTKQALIELEQQRKAQQKKGE